MYGINRIITIKMGVIKYGAKQNLNLVSYWNADCLTNFMKILVVDTLKCQYILNCQRVNL